METFLVCAAAEVFHMQHLVIDNSPAVKSQRTAESRNGICLCDQFVIGKTDLRSAKQLQSLAFVQFSVAFNEEYDRFSIDIHDHGFDCILYVKIQVFCYFFNSLAVRCGNFFDVFHFSIVIFICRKNFSDFQIGRIGTAVAIDERIFTKRSDGLEFFGKKSAHDTGIGFYDSIVNSDLIERFLIGIEHLLIGYVQSGFILIERVGVFHDEFLDSYQTETCSRFISKLGLKLIEIKWHVLIGTDHRFSRIGKQFFVGRPQNHVLVVSILQFENGRTETFHSSGFFIILRRNQGRHLDFLRSGSVHMLTDDILDLVLDS